MTFIDDWRMIWMGRFEDSRKMMTKLKKKIVNHQKIVENQFWATSFSDRAILLDIGFFTIIVIIVQWRLKKPTKGWAVTPAGLSLDRENILKTESEAKRFLTKKDFFVVGVAGLGLKISSQNFKNYFFFFNSTANRWIASPPISSDPRRGWNIKRCS